MTLRYALVTGASGGIGAATARALASEGCSVWVTYSSNSSEARATARDCIANGARDVRVSELDLRSPDSIAALIADIDQVWGKLTVLVNNAAICNYTKYDEIGIDEWDETMETNARGTFLLSRAALPLLRKGEGDRSITNVASIAGQIGSVTTGMHYAASKGAILAITRSLARALATEGIRVNAVTPGPISSSITNKLAPAARDSLSSVIPLGRFGSPDEVAWIIAAAASPRASFVTGATYDVNGGLRID